MSTELTVVVFLKENPEPEDIEKIKRILVNVKEWRFIDGETAKKEFEDKFPELSHLLSELSENPFPPSFELKIDSGRKNQFYSIEKSLKEIPSVVQIYNSGDLSRQVGNIGRIIVLVGMFLSSILFVASIFTIFNTIRLNLVYYKDIIEILRLVGASLSFVKIPFYLLGFFLGFAGGIVSIIFLFLITRTLFSYVSPFLNTVKGFFPFVFLPLPKIIQILAISTIISLFTTWISIKSYMK
jgi:cell division transport system permease protein